MAHPPLLGTVLVVDDEDDLRSLLGAHLRSVGFDVLEARDGREAVEIATERLPDVIIMEIGLPVMDGVTATRVLRADARTTSIPVVMLTARSRTSDVVRGLEAGAQEYLFKPFDMAEFLARVQTVFKLACARRDLDQRNTKLEAEVHLKARRLQLLYDFMRELNRAEEAERWFGHCLDLSATSDRERKTRIDCLYYLGALRFRARDYERSAAIMERVLSLFPAQPEARYYLGMSYRQLGRLDEAREQLEIHNKMVRSIRRSEPIEKQPAP